MVAQQTNLNVVVTYGDLRVEFNGSPEAVLTSINNFISKQIPAIDLANKISVNYPVLELIEMFGELVKITPEGPRVWLAEKKFSDKGIVALQLVAARIGVETGKSPNVALSIGELQSYTGLKSKTISSRISEMTKLGYVERLSQEGGIKYRITTQGIYWLNSFISKKGR